MDCKQAAAEKARQEPRTPIHVLIGETLQKVFTAVKGMQENLAGARFDLSQAPLGRGDMHANPLQLDHLIAGRPNANSTILGNESF